MANEQNLRPSEYKLSQEEAKKGGIASGKARRQKASLRKLAQEVLDGTYHDKDGQEVTGAELVLKGLIENISAPNGKNWGKAIDLLVMLTGASMSPEQRENLKASTEKIKAETKRLQGDAEQHSGMLEDLIKGLREDVHTETESPNADVAEGRTEADQPT